VTSYEAVKTACLVALCLLIAAVVAHTLPLADELAKDEPTLAGKAILALDKLADAETDVHNIQVDTTRTEAEMAGLLNATRHSMLTPAQTKELVDRAANLMDNANLSVIRLGEAADSLRGIPPTVQGAIQQIAQDAHNTMTSGKTMLDAAAADLSDPAIKQSIENVQEASKQTAAATRNVADTTADIKAYVHRETAPVRGFWHGLRAAINFVWSVRGAAGI
jgi:hypothetical protein